MEELTTEQLASMTKIELLALQLWLYLNVFYTAYVSRLLVITTLLALFIYFNLLFRPPFYGNNTFKLFVLSGISDLLSCHASLFVNEFLSYPIMFEFYESLKDSDMYKYLAALEEFLNGIALHSDFFVAHNRLNALTSPGKKQNKLSFYANLLFILLTPTIKIIDMFTFTPKVLIVVPDSIKGTIMISQENSTNNVLTITYTIQSGIISGATLLINIYLALILVRKRKLVERESRRNPSEMGLVMTSIISYLSFSIYQLNSWGSTYLSIKFCKAAEFFFQGISSMVPFWCLLIFSPAIRQSVFAFFSRKNVTKVSSQGQ